MDFKTLIDKLNTKQNGAFIKIEYVGELPVNAKAKKLGTVGTKVTEMTIRKGIDYSNMKVVKEKVANGKVLTHELPWGNWKAGYEGLIIEHKGQNYVRLYPTVNSVKSKYFINNNEMTYQELETSNVLVGSFFKKSAEKSDCFTIKVDNISTIY